MKLRMYVAKLQNLYLQYQGIQLLAPNNNQQIVPQSHPQASFSPSDQSSPAHLPRLVVHCLQVLLCPPLLRESRLDQMALS